MAPEAVEGSLRSVRSSSKSLRQCCMLFYAKLFSLKLILEKLCTLLPGVWGKMMASP